MSAASPQDCPLCGSPAYGWLTLPGRLEHASVGMVSPVDPDAPDPASGERLIDRCTGCGTGIERGSRPVELAGELAAVSTAGADGELAIVAPNRASLQAGIGSEGWAALADWPGRLLLTPEGLELLARDQGYTLERVRFQLWGRSQAWMWQTLINGLTVHPNFATLVRRGRLRAANARSRFAFAADAVASVLAAPLVALVSFPLELIGIAVRRGGLLLATARRATG